MKSRRFSNSFLAHPPFNVSDWNGEQPEEDNRWKFCVPPESVADFN